MGIQDGQLLERESQLSELLATADAARLGQGGVAVVHGPAGAGKSTLLKDFTGRDQGLRVLRAYAGELEREFAFGLVHQLLDPVIRTASEADRERLFSGAAVSAQSLFGGAAGSAADSSFAVLHGLYWLVASLAEDEPLLLIVDDVQWADEPSLRFFDFLARRAGELPLLLTLGLRTGERPKVVDLVTALPDAAVIEVPSLSIAATTAVLAAATGTDVHPDGAQAAYVATGGNALLINELAQELNRSGSGATVAAIETVVPSSVTRSVARRMRDLDPVAARAARVMGVLGDDLPSGVLADVSGIDPLALAQGWDALRGVGLIEGTPPRFSHAMLRRAVVDGVSESEQAELHGRCALVLRDNGAELERVVTHLLAAPALGEPWAVDLLRRAAASASQEGATDLAARRLRRALEEAGRDAAPSLLVEVGLAELAVGDPRSHHHLLTAVEAGEGVLSATALAMLLAIATGERSLMIDLVTRSVRLLDDAAGLELGPMRPLLLQATLNALGAAPMLPEQWISLQRLADAIGDPLTLSMQALHAAGSGAEHDRISALTKAFLSSDTAVGLPGLEGGQAWGAVVAARAIDRPDLMDPLLERLQEVNRRGASRVSSFFEDWIRGLQASDRGQLQLAEALLRGARERCAELTDRMLDLPAATELAAVLVRMGRLDDANDVFAEFADEDLSAAQFLELAVRVRKAHLHATCGQWPRALEHLSAIDPALADWQWTSLPGVRFRALHARALLECGKHEAAIAQATQLIDLARIQGSASEEAEALLVLARSSDDLTRVTSWAEQADAAATHSPDMVLRAQTSLELGVAYRRAGRRKDARDALARARELASRSGAHSLLTEATQEHLVAGGRPQRIALSGVDALTPSERRTAEQAASGLSNRQIAERLFVTRKTVEHTLGRVFQKLDITSRAQLPEHLEARAAEAADVP